MKEVMTNSNGTTMTVIRGKDSIRDLDVLQEMVGGWITIVTIRTPKLFPVGTQLIVDEEGDLKNLEPNSAATAVYQTSGRHRPGMPIVGNAVVLTEGAQIT